MKRLSLLISLTFIVIWTSAQGLPEDGCTYYIYCDNDQPQYFYNNGDVLSVANTYKEDDTSFLWYVTTNGTTYNIQSVANTNCYFGFKTMTNSPYDWTIDQTKAFGTGNVTMYGGANSRYLVMKNNGMFDQATGVYNKETTDFSSDYCFVKYKAPEGRPITIECNLPMARGQFSLQGTTKEGNCTLYYVMGDVETEWLTGEAGNAAYQFEGFFYKGENIGKSVNVDGLAADTLQAHFTLDIFSQSYGEKWIRFGTSETNAGGACSRGEGTLMHATIDISDQSFIWCFVGTADDYVIYNRAMGSEVALSAEETEEGSPVFFINTEQAVHWTLNSTYEQAASGAGYVIAPVGITETGINSYGGVVNWPIKFWKEDGAGSHWNFERIGEGITVNYVFSGNNPYPENNTRVAYLNITAGDVTSYKSLTSDCDGLTDIYYLPIGQDVSISENVRYRGYQLTGIDRDGMGNLTVNLYADPDNMYQYLWYSNSPEGHPYRIPAIVTTSKGTLLAFTDYRPSNRDIGYGEVDIMMRRSDDNGQSWSPSECIADGVPANAPNYPYFGYGYGDAAAVADRESDEVLVICVSGKQVYASSTAERRPCIARLRSHNGGLTWSEPEDITAQFYGVQGALLTQADNEIDCYGAFFASGKILQSQLVKKGDYYRLYAAMLCRGNNVKGAYVVYSDDFGQTWQLLSPASVQAAPNSDEPKVEELSNGNIVLSGRKSSGRYFNVFQFDDNTFTTGQWGNCLQSNQQDGGISVGANSCNGEILIVYGKRTDGKYPYVYPIILQSLPQGSSRSNVGIWWKTLTYQNDYSYTSESFSKSWNKGIEVSGISSAYSTMSVQADNRIAFFYEEGPNEYCMVYVPLTLEQITNGQYRMYDPSTDGIGIINNKDNTDKNRLYDLTGRHISHPTKGLYIKGDKKFIIR